MNDDTTKRRYVRVYHLDLQTEFPEIWFDPTCLSTWLRLLSITDQAWPAPAVLPRAVRRGDLTMLQNVGLVTLIGQDRFTMKGYEKERTVRSEKARQSVSHRYERSTNVERSKNGRTTNELPARVGASASASVSDSTEGVQGEPDAVDALYRRTGDVPGPKIRSWLNELSDIHGEPRLAAMISDTPSSGMKMPDYIRSVRDRLRLEDIAAERTEKADEARRLEEKRAPLRALPPATDISEAEAKRLAAEYMAEVRR